jgi:hypothetical protein
METIETTDERSTIARGGMRLKPYLICSVMLMKDSTGRCHCRNKGVGPFDVPYHREEEYLPKSIRPKFGFRHGRVCCWYYWCLNDFGGDDFAIVELQ